MPRLTQYIFSVLITVLSSCDGVSPLALCINEVTPITEHVIDSNDLGGNKHYISFVDQYEGLQMIRYQSLSRYGLYMDYIYCVQYYKNLPIMNSEVEFRFSDQKLTKVNYYYTKIDLDVVPTLTQTRAAEIADDFFKSRTCYFVELGIFRTEDPDEPYILVYKTTTRQSDGISLYINAHSGAEVSP